MQARNVSETRMLFNHRFMPITVNPAGFVHGGHVMAHMDHVAGLTGYRFARKRIVTAAVEHMSFHSSIHAGELFICYTCVNRVWGAAMEIGVRGVEENFRTGEQTHVVSCYMTFVCLDDAGKPLPLPLIKAENDEDRRRMADAARRMSVSLMERKLGFARVDELSFRLLPEEYALCRLPRAARPEEHLAKALAASDRAGLPATVFWDHGEATAMLVLEAADMMRGIPGALVEPGFFCLRPQAPSGHKPLSPLSGVTALLAANDVYSVTAALPGGDCLFLRKENQEQVVALFDGAGYTILM